MNNQINKPLTEGIANVPVIMQELDMECGAISLAMILSYYGKVIPLEKLREDCEVSRFGANLSKISEVATDNGLVVKGMRLSPYTIFEKATYPCIVHWEGQHFVVLCGKMGDTVYINDPGRGRLSMSVETFLKSYSAICLMFSPSESVEPSESTQVTTHP